MFFFFEKTSFSHLFELSLQDVRRSRVSGSQGSRVPKGFTFSGFLCLQILRFSRFSRFSGSHGSQVLKARSLSRFSGSLGSQDFKVIRISRLIFI